MDLNEINAFADGELNREDSHRVRAAIDSDPLAREAYDRVQNLKSFVQTHATVYNDEEVWRICVGRLNELDKARRTESFVGRYSWAMAALVFVCILGAGITHRMSGNNATRGDLANMLSAAALGGGSNTSPADTRELNRFLGYGFDFAEQSTRGNWVTVDGSREFTVDGHHVYVGTFRSKLGAATLMAVSEMGLDDMSPVGTDGVYKSSSVNDLNIVGWARPDGSAFLIGPAEVEDLVKMADQINHH